MPRAPLYCIARRDAEGGATYWQGHPGAEFGDQLAFVERRDCSAFCDRREAQRIAEVLMKRFGAAIAALDVEIF